mmetsp:Transcript_5999/g.37203  ORF Transcript_5999/g.37203 Transcript_5999/m.37203 type:complete len:311 (+) Transcript_5999:3046-3978(+)
MFPRRLFHRFRRRDQSSEGSLQSRRVTTHVPLSVSSSSRDSAVPRGNTILPFGRLGGLVYSWVSYPVRTLSTKTCSSTGEGLDSTANDTLFECRPVQDFCVQSLSIDLLRNGFVEVRRFCPSGMGGPSNSQSSVSCGSTGQFRGFKSSSNRSSSWSISSNSFSSLRLFCARSAFPSGQVSFAPSWSTSRSILPNSRFDPSFLSLPSTAPPLVQVRPPSFRSGQGIVGRADRSIFAALFLRAQLAQLQFAQLCRFVRGSSSSTGPTGSARPRKCGAERGAFKRGKRGREGEGQRGALGDQKAGGAGHTTTA